MSLDITAKFEIKFWMICDGNTYYVFQALLDTRKTDRIEQGLDSQVLMKLISPHFNTQLNVTTDILFLQTFLLPRSSKNTK